MPYCMYLRKSRADLEAEARGEGETLARHLQTLTRLAARMNIDVAPSAIYREIVSGDTIAARPMMQRLLQEVQDGKWEGVLCTEVERLARGDTIDQGIVANAFKYSGTKIITPTKVYDPNNEMDEEYFEFSLFMARREYKTIKRRMQAGRAASVREGHYVGGKRPFGYEVVKCKGSKGYTLRQIPEEARIVRQAYDWYLYGDLGASAIARRLNAMGSTTYNGHPWDAGSIRNMLFQPVYAGYVQWLKRETKKSIQPGGQLDTKRPFSDQYIRAKGLHEPIVTEEEYNLVRVRAMERRTVAQIQNKHIANPLAGLIHCGKCGYAMRRRPNVNGVFLACINPTCNCSSAHLDVVISIVLDTLQSWIDQYSGKAAPAPAAAPDPAPAIAIAEEAIQQAKKQLTTAQEMLERGVYSVEEYLNRRHALQEKIDAAQAEITQIKSAPAPVDTEAQIIAVLPAVRHALSAWPYASTPAEQNALLRSCLSRIDYSKDTPLTRNANPRDHITIFLHPLHTPLCE